MPSPYPTEPCLLPRITCPFLWGSAPRCQDNWRKLHYSPALPKEQLCAFSQSCMVKAAAEILKLSARTCTCHMWGHTHRETHICKGTREVICAGACGTVCGGLEGNGCRDMWGAGCGRKRGTDQGGECGLAGCWGLHMDGLAGSLQVGYCDNTSVAPILCFQLPPDIKSC